MATYVQVCTIPILAALYLFEFRHGNPLDEMLHVEQFWRLTKTKAASGQPYEETDFLVPPGASTAILSYEGVLG